MELSPEEKDKIYKEEKARLEAQEKAKKELKEKKTKKGCLGCLGCFGAIIVFSIIILMAGGVFNSGDKTKKSTNQSSTPTVSTPSIDVSGKYEVTKYKYTDLGHSRTMVLVNKDVTQKEVEAIYKQLRKDYPEDFFELVIGRNNLIKLYNYSRKRAKDPEYQGPEEIEKIITNYWLGCIIKIPDGWKFMKAAFYKLKKE